MKGTRARSRALVLRSRPAPCSARAYRRKAHACVTTCDECVPSFRGSATRAVSGEGDDLLERRAVREAHRARAGSRRSSARPSRSRATRRVGALRRLERGRGRVERAPRATRGTPPGRPRRRSASRTAARTVSSEQRAQVLVARAVPAASRRRCRSRRLVVSGPRARRSRSSERARAPARARRPRAAARRRRGSRRPDRRSSRRASRRAGSSRASRQPSTSSADPREPVARPRPRASAPCRSSARPECAAEVGRRGAVHRRRRREASVCLRRAAMPVREQVDALDEPQPTSRRRRRRSRRAGLLFQFTIIPPAGLTTRACAANGAQPRHSYSPVPSRRQARVRRPASRTGRRPLVNWAMSRSSA